MKGKRAAETQDVAHYPGSTGPAVTLKKTSSTKATKAAKARPKKKKHPDGTPLQRFKKQTKAKRLELIKARKDIDRELKAIEKDLGKLKR